MEMKSLLSVAAGAALCLSAGAGEVVLEIKGVLTEQTPGVAFGTHDWKGYGKPCPLVKKPYADTAYGCWSLKRVKLPNKPEGKGAYFKFSYDAKYAYRPGKDGKEVQRCNQGVFFFDKKGNQLPDCYDTMYPDADGCHYERVLYAWDEVETVELFFQKPWNMKEKDGDSCSLEVSNVKIETATWEDAAAYCDRVYGQLPPLAFKPSEDFTTLLPRTMEALKSGRPWRVVLLGDSIQQDSFHSQFHALVKRAFPQSDVEWILSMRGGTGCWHYILAENFFPYIVDHKPDLLIVGGVSNGRKHDETANGRDVGPTGPDAMVCVAKLARERLGCEVLVVNKPLHVDIRMYDPANRAAALPKQVFNVNQYEHQRGDGADYAKLRKLCKDAKIQWWDAFVPCYAWLYGSGLPWGHYSRDYVHSGEFGKQVIGRVLLEYFLSGKGE